MSISNDIFLPKFMINVTFDFEIAKFLLYMVLFLVLHLMGFILTMYVLLSHNLCFISLYLDLYVLGDDVSIS